MDQIERDTYLIPPNFIESGTLFGGMVKIRNAAEAGILACAIGIPVFVCLPFGLTAKIVTLCLTALPAGLVALIGIDGESLSSFLLIWLRYRRNRRVIGMTEAGDSGKTDQAAGKTKRTGTESCEKKKEKAGKQASVSRRTEKKRPGKRKREDFPAEFDELKKYEIREKLRKAGKPRQKADSRKNAKKAPASASVKKPEKTEKEKILKKKEGSEKSRKQEKGKQEKGKQTESCLNPAADYLPVEKIQDGIIYTKDRRYLSILEITPVNFLLRSAGEQRSIIYSYLSYLKISPVKLQVKVITRKADINRHLETVRKEMEKETNEHCIQMQKDYMEFVKRVGTQEAVTRRFFLIFEYEPWNPSQRENETEAVSFLKSAVHTASAYLRNCGNVVLRPENEDEETAKALYDILCRGESVFKPFRDKVSEVVAAYASHGKNTDAIPAGEFFAPKRIDLTQSDSVCIDGLYYSWLLVPSEGYRAQVPAGWLSLIVNAGDGIDMDLFLSRQPKEQIVQKVGQQLRINRSKIRDASDTNTDYDDIDGAIRSGYYLKSGIANNEDFYYMNLLITVTAQSREELEWKEAEMKKLLLSQDMQVKSCRYREEQAYLSSLPFLCMEKKLYERSRRNVLSSGAAACYPYISYELCDDTGVMLGVNRYNSSLVVLDLFDTETYKNANMVILGTSGAGKTFTMQLLALRMRRKGIPVFIIAPLKGHEFRRACENVGGSYILISPASPYCINIMEIRKVDTSINELLDGLAIQLSALAEKIQHLHIFFRLLIPDMSYEESQLLDEALIVTYQKKGITHDNGSLEDPKNPGRYREMPVLGDVYEILKQSPETVRMANIMNRLVNGSASTFNRQTNVNLDNKYSVLDISMLTGELLTVGMYVALEYVWDRAKADRTEAKAVFIDECWQLLSNTSAEGGRLAGDFVLEIYKTIRGYAGAAICASQDLYDFLRADNGRFGKGIINNSKTKIILNLEEDEAVRVQDALHLSDAEIMEVTHFERGTGLISTNNNNVIVDFKASPLEKELITTDRKELKKIAERLRRQKEAG